MIKKIFAPLVFQILLVLIYTQCNHRVFCNPQILQAAANSNLFNDSKTFVDLVLKQPVEQILINFKKQSTHQFLQTNFHSDPTILLSPVQFTDFQQNPQILNKIQDPLMRTYANELNKRWNLLGKKVNLSAASTVGTCRVECSSYLPQIDNFTMLMPGGRFRESYYWDSYWIVLGLIATDMLDTAQNIIDNFAMIIAKYGFIPNGLRQYFLSRSQPPFLFMMVKDLAKAFRDKGYVQRANNLEFKMYKYLKIQHEYWQNTHKLSVFIDGAYYQLNQYRANTKTARPESFRQDMQTVARILSPEQKIRVWKGLSSMAESGWDFSSRWLRNNSLITTQIDQIIPTDLIALIAMMEKYLADLSLNFKQLANFQKYTFKYTQKISYFKTVRKDNRFPDYRFDKNEKPDYVYPTDYMPLIFLQEKTTLQSIYREIVNPQTSILRTGQQWDSPNVWAPNNWIVHQVTSGDQAKKYATQWVLTTYCSFKQHNAIFEKYDAYQLGKRGQGGEYQAQVGFGWTNGLALYYLSLYPQIKAIQC